MKRTTMNKLSLITLAFLFALQNQAFSHGSFKYQKEVKKVISQYVKNEKLSGSIRITEGDHSLYAKSFGYSNYEFSVKNNNHTKYILGSLGKQYTAAAILKLVEQGKLKLNDKINQYLKDPSSKWKDITIHQVLTHTAGLERWIHAGSKDKFAFYKPLSFKDLYEKLKTKDLLFNPGEKWVYSNIGYQLLGQIIRTASKMSYEDFVKKYLFLPHHLKNTGESYVGVKLYDDSMWSEKAIKKLAKGYFFNPTTKSWISEFRYYMRGSLAGAGGTHATTLDFHKWFRALRDHRVLSSDLTHKLFAAHAETTDKTKDGTPIYYGYGWQILNHKKYGQLIFHSGSTGGGHNAMFIYSVAKDISISIFTNLEVLKDTYFYQKNLSFDILKALHGNQ